MTKEKLRRMDHVSRHQRKAEAAGGVRAPRLVSLDVCAHRDDARLWEPAIEASPEPPEDPRPREG
ncbi:MAG: hypothetical protein ACLQLG_08860 [Thermoguttaceae bacterium]